MRARSTWQKNGNESPRQAATSRRADVYTMNQDHPQPSATEYENGDPDAWAETPVPGDKMNVNAEYDGDHVKRNEIGLGEMRDDTYKHKDSDVWGGPGKYDNAKVAAERKASAAERIAKALLRTSNTKLVEDMAVDLMAMPDRTMVATLRRLDQVSVASLPPDSKMRRALACTKLAAAMLGPKSEDSHVEKLANAFMRVEDPILKDMLGIVRSARVAQDQGEQQEQEPQAHQGQEEGEEEEDEAQAHQGQAEQEDVDASEEAETAAAAEACLSPEETSLLDSILMGEAAAHGVAPPSAPDDLTAIFESPAAPMAPPPVMTVPAVAAAQGGSDISFEDDDDDAPRTASGVSDAAVDDLFGDDNEVQAQRQIRAAEQEQAARAAGYSVGRTASAKPGAKGVKKIGQVQKAPAVSADAAIDNLWDSP
jgi:hypothetical protein